MAGRWQKVNGVTPEHLVTVTQGATPVQIVTLVVLGIIAFGVVVGIVKWVIDIKLGTLPQDLNAIRHSLGDLKNDMVRLDSKMWSTDDIQREIKSAITDHIERCPFHRQE